VGVDEVRNFIAAIAAVVAAIGILGGLVQYIRSERWKRAEFVAKLIAEFEADHRIDCALKMLESRKRKVNLFPEAEERYEKWPEVDDELVERSLRIVRDGDSDFGANELRVRDCFDHLFKQLDRFDIFVQRGLVTADAFQPYLAYWLDILGDPQSRQKPRELLRVMWEYVDEYGYSDMQSLFKRFGYNIART